MAIYLGIVSFIFSVQLKLTEKLIQKQSGSLQTDFSYLTLGASLFVLFISFIYLIRSILPRRYAYLKPPGSYLQSSEKLYESLRFYRRVAGMDPAQATVERTHQTLMKDLADASDRNYANNNARSGYLAKASWFLAIAIFLTLILFVLYFYLGIG